MGISFSVVIKLRLAIAGRATVLASRPPAWEPGAQWPPQPSPAPTSAPTSSIPVCCSPTRRLPSVSRSTSVVLPLVVIEELDRQKGRPGRGGGQRPAGRSASWRSGRLTARRLARAPSTSLPGGTLRIEPNGVAHDRLPEILDPRTPDHRLLSACLSLAEHGTHDGAGHPDAALRIKGAQLGVTVQDYRADTVAVERVLLRGGRADRGAGGDRPASTPTGRWCFRVPSLLVNQFVVLQAGPIPLGGGPGDPGRAGCRWRSGFRARDGRSGSSPRTCARPSPSTCCSTPRSRRYRSWDRPAPARPSWRWPPGWSRCWRRAATARCPSTGR